VTQDSVLGLVLRSVSLIAAGSQLRGSAALGPRPLDADPVGRELGGREVPHRVGRHRHEVGDEPPRDAHRIELGNIAVRRPGEPEVYAETADLHQRFSPNNPDWGHPPLEDEVRATDEGWGPPNGPPAGLFGPTIVRWYPMVQWFDGAGFADLLRTTSLYRRLAPSVREPLLDAIAERIRMQMGDHVARRYLSVLCAGQRID